MIITFSATERNWCARNARKMYNLFKGLTESKQFAVWESLCTSFEVPSDDVDWYVISLTKVQNRQLHDLVMTQLATLTTNILPAYEKRISNEPGLSSYITRVNNTIQMLNRLANKLEEAR